MLVIIFGYAYFLDTFGYVLIILDTFGYAAEGAHYFWIRLDTFGCGSKWAGDRIVAEKAAHRHQMGGRIAPCNVGPGPLEQHVSKASKKDTQGCQKKAHSLFVCTYSELLSHP